MNTIRKDVIYSQEINKSQFITYLKKVETVQDAKAYMEEVKALHPDATHHVTLYIIGNSGEQGHANDDGEPSGTAAMPAFDVFKKNNVTNFVCIIVRYFGGIKLGAGGLVRAYSSSAALALKEAEISEIISMVEVTLKFAYTYLKPIENSCKEYTITNKTFDTLVSMNVKLPEKDFDNLKEKLIGLTNNQISIER